LDTTRSSFTPEGNNTLDTTRSSFTPEGNNTLDTTRSSFTPEGNNTKRGAEISTSSEEIDMASRGRRGVPAREGEQRRDEPQREDQGEQYAPAPQGHVLPPPPPVDYGVFMQSLVQAMQTQAHTQATLQVQLEAQEPADVWLVAFDHRTLEQALSAACRQEGEMEQYLEEKKASQKRPAAPFQRQERKKAAFQSPQHSVASGSSQVPSQRSPSGQKECPHCGRVHGGTECWKLAGKCLKCGSSEHRIKDCPRLQQGVDVDHKTAATSMDAYLELTAIDVDVYLPDLLRFQIRKRLRKCCP
ncbi:hypothetical protein Taro_008537, partial [Colocasia esculenta]|nr:hypothetical protein [Colocasia esculenta]